MEDNSNMPGPTTSEANEAGGNGENLSDTVEVFGDDDSNGITCGLYSFNSLCLNK